MDYDSLMKVENVDDKIHIFAWDGERFPIKPGATRLVPFQALINAMGDPRSGPQITRITPERGGVPMSIPARRDEIKRLNTLYGTYTDGVYDPSYVEHTNGQTLFDRIPKVVVTSIDADSEEPDTVIFPCDDPDCTRFIPEDADKSQTAVMQRQYDQMRRKMAVMEQMLKAQTGNTTAESLGEGTEVTEDTPQQTRRTSRTA